MVVYADSRYRDSTQTIYETDDFTRPIINERKPITEDDIGQDFTVHTVVEGDQLDLLAYQYGGDSSLWWIIADLNKVNFPLDPKIGTQLKIPSREFFARW